MEELFKNGDGPKTIFVKRSMSSPSVQVIGIRGKTEEPLGKVIPEGLADGRR
jgi:hypothetical protein